MSSIPQAAIDAIVRAALAKAVDDPDVLGTKTIAAYRIGYLVNAFDVDERGVHVKRDEFEIRQLLAGFAVAQDEARG